LPKPPSRGPIHTSVVRTPDALYAPVRAVRPCTRSTHPRRAVHTPDALSNLHQSCQQNWLARRGLGRFPLLSTPAPRGTLAVAADPPYHHLNVAADPVSPACPYPWALKDNTYVVAASIRRPWATLSSPTLFRCQVFTIVTTCIHRLTTHFRIPIDLYLRRRPFEV
jgi:hypothetical protein